ncbi:hypothetical protein CYLTODRAFT_419177 [Cylindrobasidium torrendii FP15055 ss-10]|uniref:Uncharacterized protein n=1 Tax=Cylindrobasidium torrendii FP15055 ss-10 TaxID=1314674 RepID=A0A0D7BLL3_9AGAR|nr:hypothetical protein CYLTODRAFT_419177 [Cylindrobasidium torrendii FP15055 ss-10]
MNSVNYSSVLTTHSPEVDITDYAPLTQTNDLSSLLTFYSTEKFRRTRADTSSHPHSRVPSSPSRARQAAGEARNQERALWRQALEAQRYELAQRRHRSDPKTTVIRRQADDDTKYTNPQHAPEMDLSEQPKPGRSGGGEEYIALQVLGRLVVNSGTKQ